VELLTLFADKGVAIQNLKIENQHLKVILASITHQKLNALFRLMT